VAQSNPPIASEIHPLYRERMVDLKLQQPVTEEVEVDAETAAAIQRGLKAAEEGRTVPAEEVPKLISQWISKFSTRNPR
jgi:predicted transcriptional regulator